MTGQALGNLCGGSPFEVNTCRPGADDGGGGRQERDGEADGAVGSDG